MRILRVIFCVAVATGAFAAESNADLKEQVRQTEIAFAKTMADRNFAAFATFLAKDSIFFGSTQTSRGPEQIKAAWKAYYDAPSAPFSWAPERVEVLDSGTLAVSSGPVRDPSGKQVGTFNSVWRREKQGVWKVIIDKGCPPCNCAAQ